MEKTERIERIEKTEKNAIVVLTRGYTNILQYKTLINRNISISKNLNLLEKETIDILIFHEGNILQHHQLYISRFTPNLKLFFINIKEHAFKQEKKYIQVYQPTSTFGLNYRHMCSFWFVDFWNYVEEYNKIIRIDEDCIIDFNISEMFCMLQSKVAIYGMWTKDEDFVTSGLNDFTRVFLKENIPDLNNHYIIKHNPSGPYTNVFCLNLSQLRDNKLIQNYIKEVKLSNCIYKFRWGDLQLWGEVLFYLCDPSSYIKTNKIKYFHGSHKVQINSTFGKG